MDYKQEYETQKHRANAAERERDEWKSRAEKAEQEGLAAYETQTRQLLASMARAERLAEALRGIASADTLTGAGSHERAEGFCVWTDGTLTLACESCGTLIDKIVDMARAALAAEEGERT
jgi:hypothetical protein